MALFTRLKANNFFRSSITFYDILRKPYHALTSTRTTPPVKCFRSFFNFSRNRTIQQLKEKDNVADNFVLIYRNTMYRYLFFGQLISYLAGGVVILGLISKDQYKDRKEGLPWSKKAVSSHNEEILYMTCLTAFLVILQVIVARAPLRIYKVPQSKEYVTVSYGAFFNLKKYSFKHGQISQLPTSEMLPWRNARFLVERTATDKRILFLIEPYFRRPADLFIMLGEQEDPDLEE